METLSEQERAALAQKHIDLENFRIYPKSSSSRSHTTRTLTIMNPKNGKSKTYLRDGNYLDWPTKFSADVAAGAFN